MSHPMNKFRQSNVERSRVGAITGGTGLGAKQDAVQDKSTIKSMLSGDSGDIGGVKAAMRADRPMRARGGKVGKKATTIVNVITGGQAQPPAPPPMPMPPPEAMAPPPPPPGPPMPPQGAIAGPPPGMGGPPPSMPMRAKGGKVTAGSAGTKISHDKGKNDLGDINRPRQITFASGGGVKSFTAYRGSNKAGGAGGGLARIAKAKKY